MLTSDNRPYPLFSMSPEPCSLQLANDVQSGCEYVPQGAGMSSRYIKAGGFQGFRNSGGLGRVGALTMGIPEHIMLAGLAGVILWLIYRKRK